MGGNLNTKVLVLSAFISFALIAKEYRYEDILDHAFNNSPTLKMIEKDKEITKSMKKEYLGKGFPVIEGNFNVQHQPKQYYPFELNFGESGGTTVSSMLDPNEPGYVNDATIAGAIDQLMLSFAGIDMSPKKNTIAMDLALTQPLFAQGKVVTGLKIAKVYLEILDIKYEEAKLTLAKDIKSGYDATLLATLNMQIANEAVVLAKKSHSLTKLRYESGKGNLLDTLNSQYELQNKILNRREALKKRDLAIKNLFTLANLNESVEGVTLVGQLEDLNFSLSHKEALTQMLDKNRTIRQLNKAKKLQELQTTLVKSDVLPTVYCGGSLGKITQFNKDDDIEWHSDNKIFVGTKLELFSGGQRIQRIKQAKGEEEKIEKTILDIENKLKLALANYYEELEVAREELIKSKDLKLLTEKALKISQLAYETGQITHQELKDSEQRVNLSRLAYNAALYNMNSAVNNIYLLIAEPKLIAGK